MFAVPTAHTEDLIYWSDLSTSEKRIAATRERKTFADRLRGLAIISHNVSTLSLFYLFTLRYSKHG